MFLVGAMVFGFSAALGVDGCWSNNTGRRWPLWGIFLPIGQVRLLLTDSFSTDEFARSVPRFRSFAAS